jgi:4-hydroxybenzoate polyprenyltransferase
MQAYFSLIKFAHTIFALPFALIGLSLGIYTTGLSDWTIILKVLACMVFARSAAMAFNRWADVRYDAANQRTAGREIPAGILSRHQVLGFVILNATAFVAVCYTINSICFYLSPIALAIILGYSFTKRWTFLCHLFLGLGLALAPIGAYLAVTGQFDPVPIWLAAIVFFWVSGFDIIYALQDEAFDKANHLYSIPAHFGPSTALRISRVLHFVCGVLVLISIYLIWQQYDSMSLVGWVGAFLFIFLLIWQHRLIKPHDLSKVNQAFFTTNGIASILFGSCIILDLLF